MSSPPSEGSQAPDNRRMYLFLAVLTLCVAVSFQGWRMLYNNFAVDVVGLDGLQNGVVQSVREVPGFLALLVIYLLLFISEHRLAALSVAIVGLGTAMAGYLPSFAGLAFTTVVMSFGLHYFETLNQSLSLQYFSLAEAPVVIGRLRGLLSLGNLTAGGIILAISGLLDFRETFLAMAVPGLAAGLLCLAWNPSDRNIEPQRRSMVFKRKYWLFYLLNFLAGARRQVFVAFAVFLLVQKFHYSVRMVTVLFVVNNMANYFFSPLVGRAIARYGERAVLSVEYGGLCFVFLTYAYTQSAVVAGAAYVADHLLFNGSMAIRTYFQKIGERADISGSMAMGFTINHIAAVVIPALGGWIWLTDYRVTFLAGAAMSLASLALCRLIGPAHGAAGAVS